MASGNTHDDSRNSGRMYNRRKLIATGSGLAIGSIAGCSQLFSREERQSSASNNDQSKLAEDAITIPSIHNPDSANWQPFSPKFPSDTANLYLHVTSKSFLTGNTKLILIDDWNYDPETKTRTLAFKKGFKWWNGDPLTAEDLYTGAEIQRLQNPQSAAISKNELVDEYTIKQTYSNKQSPSLVEKDIGQRVQTYRGLWKPWLEKYRDASTQTARDEITADLQKFQITTQEWIDKGLGNGPYKLVDYSSTGYTGEKWDDHPWADKITVPTLEQRIYNDRAVFDQLVTNDRIDANWDTPFPNRLRDVAPSHFETLAEYGFPWVAKLIMNWDGPAGSILSQQGVRRAILAAIDIENIVANNDGNGIEVSVQTGMDPTMAENWLGQEFIDKLIEYPLKADFERAEEFLKTSSCTRSDGKIVDQDGTQVEFRFLSQNKTFRKFTADTIAKQLEEFGFKIDFQTMSWTQLEPHIFDQLDFDLHVNSHYGAINYHPIDYYRPVHLFGVRLMPFGGLDALLKWHEEGKEYSPYNGKPMRPKIPREIGATELGNDPIEVDWVALWQELQQSESTERSTEIVKLFARTWNFQLQGIDCFQRINGMWGDTENFQWPEKDSDQYKVYHQLHHLIKSGQVKARQA